MSIPDYAPSTVVRDKFNTFRPSTAVPYTLAGTPALSVYKDNSTTQSTTGVTLTVDFDGVTGLHDYAVDTSADGTFYSAGSSFTVVITTGTVDSVSFVGTIVGRFTLNKQSALRPTTAGRTLDVSAGGEAGVDWANVGSPTTAVNLSGTDIQTVANGALTAAKFGSLTAPSAVPAAAPTLFDAIAWLFTLGRNKITQTATTQTLRNDADSGTIGTSTVSDDGTTATRGKWT